MYMSLIQRRINRDKQYLCWFQEQGQVVPNDKGKPCA